MEKLRKGVRGKMLVSEKNFVEIVNRFNESYDDYYNEDEEFFYNPLDDLSEEQIEMLESQIKPVKIEDEEDEDDYIEKPKPRKLKTVEDYDREKRIAYYKYVLSEIERIERGDYSIFERGEVFKKYI